MKTKLKNQNHGFTIIEVMIVLTIAGLILLIVFLAVPALQRSSRNTQRKADVSQILASVSDYVSNNQGQLPTTSGTVNAEFVGSNPKLGYYTTPANVTYVYNATAPATPTADPASPDKVVVANYEVCTGNAAATTNATTRSVIALFDIEGSGGNVEQCVQD